MRKAPLKAWLSLITVILAMSAGLSPHVVLSAEARLDEDGMPEQVLETVAQARGNPAEPNFADQNLAHQLPEIEPAPVIFEARSVFSAELPSSDTESRTALSVDGAEPDVVVRDMPGIEVVAREDGPAASAPEASAKDVTGGIAKKSAPASAVDHDHAEGEKQASSTKAGSLPVIVIEPGHAVTASMGSLPGQPAVSAPQEPSADLREHRSDQPAAPKASTAGGGIYGPELPDAALAKIIMAKLASARGPFDQQIAEAYAGRANRPLWVADGVLTASARSALGPLEKAADFGLKADAYPVRIALDSPEAIAETDLSLTRAMLRYARDARGARINPRRISALITAEPTIPDVASILDTLSKAESAGASLVDFQPQQPGFVALKDKLALLRAGPPEQRAADSRKDAEIVANMERWRWLPRDLGSTYIMVNVPAFELKVIRDGKIIHETKVIVGKPQTPTPIFSHAMEYLIVNPYWNIPPSIALKEMLPQLQRDPYALRRKGFEIVQGGHEVDPAGIDWSSGIRNIRIRQPPGERNALGFIKFMFPNDHAVYLHDTPSRGLFSSAVRAFSHGCVRVFEPFGLAEILLADQSGISARQLRGMIGKGERTIPLQTRIPVHIAYFTEFVDEAGMLQTRPDIYGHSAKVRAALGI